MKKQIVIMLVSVMLLSGFLWIFQENAEALSGEIVSFVFSLSSAIVFGFFGYVLGCQKGTVESLTRRQAMPSDSRREGSVQV